MTPKQKLIQLIVKNAAEAVGKRVNLDNIEEVENFYDENDCHDAENELRYSGEETDLDCEWSRNYESKARAIQVLDGSWVGYTFYSGGGKYGCADEIDWISNVYEVKIVKEIMVPKRIFEKV